MRTFFPIKIFHESTPMNFRWKVKDENEFFDYLMKLAMHIFLFSQIKTVVWTDIKNI